ncbi:hypothetical protein PoB_000495000 [Plakobranchus ocellatus]|uniref:Secreted protein n=1 Tax=Plakobranchus ocellatus TaxID=259542 RepID=A0AAV3Y7J1_9GAST|nr:hypothetical protein PoB_000495000 [Plakobranchus ocellatus]
MPFVSACLLLYIATPQQVISGFPSDQGADGGARTHDRSVPADLRADSPATEPSRPPFVSGHYNLRHISLEEKLSNWPRWYSSHSFEMRFQGSTEV